MFGGIGYVLVGEIFVPLFRVASSLSFGWAILYFILSRCCARGKDSMKYLTLLNESDDEDELYDLNSNNLAAIKGIDILVGFLIQKASFFIGEAIQLNAALYFVNWVIKKIP